MRVLGHLRAWTDTSTGILRGMPNRPDIAEPYSGTPFLHALVGTVLLAIGGVLFVNLNEDPETFMVLTVLFTGPGLYLLITGAVARGIALGRR